VVVLLEDTIESLKIAAPKASGRLLPASAAKLAALLEDLQAAEQLAPTPLGALQGLLAFLVMHAWSAQGAGPRCSGCPTAHCSRQSPSQCSAARHCA
jgi:hypothetical protein